MKRRTMLFEQFKQVNAFEMIVESISGDIKDVQGEVKDVMDELGKEGAESDEIKAALLMQAIEKDGDIEDIDLDKLKKDVKEGVAIRGVALNESAGGIIHTIELIGNFAGNSAFLEFILEKIEKVTGKKMDAGKVKDTIEKIVGALKKVTGLPAKAIEKFFGWIAEKCGLGESGQKGMELVGMVAVIIFFLTLGIIHFPVLGTGVMWWLLSLTGLAGKGIELFKIGKEISHLVANAGKNKEAADEIGVSGDELEKLATA